VAKGELKTVRNDASVADLIAGVANEERRRDTQVVVDLMAEITGQAPVMWGTSIVGVRRLAEVDEAVLRELITRSWQHGTPMGAV
jgi:hypothetical protein